MEDRSVNMKEEWIKVKTLDSWREYLISRVVQDDIGTKILLSNKKKFIEISFDGQLSMVRLCEDNIRMRTWGEVQKKYNNKFFFVDCFLYRIENSKLIEWLIREDYGFSEGSNLIHYCISVDFDFIDVVSKSEPTIRVYEISETSNNT